ncbi:hypothetical protein CDAR_79621 [Caerostris darwini]|uniref:Uncharacterized protein n=1 Tax=Caerostris darwini TaxID=1538125 RepID=A0AAV4UNT5_9ARAC|nr:hypothetical protein CDAR_79621 [Caerostris darwini]
MSWNSISIHIYPQNHCRKLKKIFKGSYRERARLRTGIRQTTCSSRSVREQAKSRNEKEPDVPTPGRTKAPLSLAENSGTCSPQRISDEFVDEKFGEAILLGGIEITDY